MLLHCKALGTLRPGEQLPASPDHPAHASSSPLPAMGSMCLLGDIPVSVPRLYPLTPSAIGPAEQTHDK